jgi:predicted nucleic acid-binding Zn ribbon protein
MPKASPRSGKAPASEPTAPPVAPHGHCAVCGHSIAVGEGLCSDACVQVWGAQRRRQRRTSFIFLGFLVLLMLVWLFAFSRGAG